MPSYASETPSLPTAITLSVALAWTALSVSVVPLATCVHDVPSPWRTTPWSPATHTSSSSPKKLAALLVSDSAQVPSSARFVAKPSLPAA